VGGNIGWYTLLSASMGAKVDVFEPNPKNFLRMCESICVNSWMDGQCTNLGDLAVQGSNRNGRVRIFPVGVGSGELSALFGTGLESRNNPGAGAIVETISVSKASMKKYTQIQIVSLDEMAKQLGWYDETIDIMKIDVEGYEIHVIRGAKKLLKSNRIKNIFMEGDVTGPAKQKKFRELVRTFADAGYVVFKIGGFSGPSDTDVPPMDENIERSLAEQCTGMYQKRKKCNLWWKLASEAKG
jgi:FkbM family methyltransferase